MDYQEIIDRRRALAIEPFRSLAEVGFDGPWVTPYQITSKSSDGPVLVALHWLDEPSILQERATLQKLGYLPNIRFNTVIDAALARHGLGRSDIYVTQTFHLVPRTRSERIPQAAMIDVMSRAFTCSSIPQRDHFPSLQLKASYLTPAGADLPARKMQSRLLMR